MWKFDSEDYVRRVLGSALKHYVETGELPDYFERFDLPTDVSDQSELEKAIQTVYAYWSKTKQNIKYTKLLNVLCSDKEMRDARRILLDPNARNAARLMVEQRRQRRLDAQFETLDRSIGLAAGKGFITPQERAALLSRYTSQGLTQSQIQERLRPIRVQELRANRPSEGLPKDVRRRIREDLRVLGKRDLYDFLSVPSGCTKAQLLARYQETEREWRPRPNDHLRTSANSLMGTVKAHLIDKDPQNYEDARCFEIIEKMAPDIQLAGADKRIDHQKFSELVKMAVAEGLDASTATDLILGAAVDMGISVEWTASGDTIVCPNCWASAPIKGAPDRCAICQHPLWKHCPKCRSRLPAKLETCGQCAFVLPDFPRVRLLIRMTELALEDGLLANALESAREAERIWGREGEVQDLFLKIEERRKKLEVLRDKFEKQLSERRLGAARAALSSLQWESPEYKFPNERSVKDIASDLDAQIKRVADIVDKGYQHEQSRQFNDAVRAYDQALSLAQDCEEARKGLERCPPEPPGKPQTSLHGDSVHVEWAAGPAVGKIEYKVVRRQDRAPASLQDGVLVMRTTALSCVDDKAPSGILLFYSVFAERAGAVSAPAIGSGLLTAVEVKKLMLVASNGVVNGTWESPPTGARVRITRKEGSTPSQPGDGIEIPASGQSFVDTAVRNGIRYYYRVFVEYHHSRGGVVITPGQAVSATPDQPPTPVVDLRIRRDRGAVALVWTPPPRGTVRIYRVTTPPQKGGDSPTAASEIAEWGPPLRNKSTVEVIDPSPLTGLSYYVPVTFVGDLAVIGGYRKYVPVSDITGLGGEDCGDYIQLRWRWPNDCAAAVVTWRKDAYPKDPQETGTVVRNISRGDYERRGGFRISNPDPAPYRIAVFAVSRVDGEEVFSSGLDSNCRMEFRTQPKREMAYAFERGTLFHNSTVTIQLKASHEIPNLPELVVVGRSGEIQPTKVQDGEVLLTLGGLQIHAGSVVSRQFKISRTPVYVRAFFRDPAAYASFRLIDPPATQMKMR
jgi:hypothetical protein